MKKIVAVGIMTVLLTLGNAYAMMGGMGGGGVLGGFFGSFGGSGHGAGHHVGSGHGTGHYGDSGHSHGSSGDHHGDVAPETELTDGHDHGDQGFSDGYLGTVDLLMDLPTDTPINRGFRVAV